MTTNQNNIPEPTALTSVARARELLDKATPGPWEAVTCHESEQKTRSEYVRGALLKPDAPAHGLWMTWSPDSRLGVHLTAVTGDGPHGEADAELIAAAPTLLAELADEVESERSLRTQMARELLVLTRAAELPDPSAEDFGGVGKRILAALEVES